MGLCRDRVFYVAIELATIKALFRSRQSWASHGWRPRQKALPHMTELGVPRLVIEFVLDKRVWCCNKAFYVVTKFCQTMSFLVTTKCFYVETELTMVERFYVVREYFMWRWSVAKLRGFVLQQGILCCYIVG